MPHGEGYHHEAARSIGIFARPADRGSALRRAPVERLDERLGHAVRLQAFHRRETRVDLGKDICSVVGLDEGVAVRLRRRMRRKTLVRFAAELPGCVIAMESCCGALYVGRIFADWGHEVRLMPPEYVRLSVKAHKNDDRDAEAISEAASRPTMGFVTLKTEEQLDMQWVGRYGALRNIAGIPWPSRRESANHRTWD